MRAYRRRRLNRNAADQLLRSASAGWPADPSADDYALASLLAAAAPAPAAHQRELAGEARAVLAFRTALLKPASQPRRPSMSATKLLAVKAVLAAVGVTGGGVALAAATGHLPSNLTGTSAAARPAASASASPAANGKPASHPAASPSPSLRGLCRAYTAHVGSSPGKALDNPAFSALVTAAGGKDHAAAYCATLLATSPGNKPTSHPGNKPTSHPGNKTSSPAAHGNSTHPAGKPTAHPTGAPTSHP